MVFTFHMRDFCRMKQKRRSVYPLISLILCSVSNSKQYVKTVALVIELQNSSVIYFFFRNLLCYT